MLRDAGLRAPRLEFRLIELSLSALRLFSTSFVSSSTMSLAVHAKPIPTVVAENRVSHLGNRVLVKC